MAIVKVQVPLASSEAAAPALVYDEQRRRREFIPMADLPEAVRRALGGDPKGYFEAEWVKGCWRIGKRVGDQPW